MEYWPWWVSGFALSGVMVFHWFALRRMMAVSGRVTSLVDRLQYGAPEEVSLSSEEMLAAILAATKAEFGDDGESSEATAPVTFKSEAPQTVGPPPRTPLDHFLFFFGLASGGALAAWFGGGLNPTPALHSSGLATLSGDSLPSSWALLALGGILVGFGTRMSGGCTSGHGLCGASRLQPGSLLATLSFFGAGIIVSFGLQVLL